MSEFDDLTMKAQSMLNESLIMKRLLSYDSVMQPVYDIFWNKHGKTICKRDLIKSYENINDKLHEEMICNPTIAYLAQPAILKNEKLIQAINNL